MALHYLTVHIELEMGAEDAIGAVTTALLGLDPGVIVVPAGPEVVDEAEIELEEEEEGDDD